MPFDPQVLLESFQNSLSLLYDLGDKIQKRVEKLEFLCAKQEKDHAGRVKQLEPMFQVNCGTHVCTCACISTVLVHSTVGTCKCGDRWVWWYVYVHVQCTCIYTDTCVHVNCM